MYCVLTTFSNVIEAKVWPILQKFLSLSLPYTNRSCITQPFLWRGFNCKSVVGAWKWYEMDFMWLSTAEGSIWMWIMTSKLSLILSLVIILLPIIDLTNAETAFRKIPPRAGRTFTVNSPWCKSSCVCQRIKRGHCNKSWPIVKPGWAIWSKVCSMPNRGCMAWPIIWRGSQIRNML